jgi:Spy/CpxP family protein refolding chaperone
MNTASRKTAGRRAAVGWLAGLVLSASAVAEAGPWHEPGRWERPTAEERVEHLGEKLGLSEEQKAEVLDVVTAADAEREAMRIKHEQAIRADMCSLAAGVSEQLKAVLTEEQSTDLDELMARRAALREEFAAEHGGRHRPPPADCDDPGV